MRIRLAMSCVTGTVVVALIACGIDIPEVVPIDDGGSDATIDVGTADVLSNDAAKDVGGPDVITPPTCDAGCGFALPQGFGLVTFSAGSTPPCDPGQTASDVVSDPQVGAGACTCGCAISAPPDCSNGTVKTKYDSNNSVTCPLNAISIIVSGPACTALNTSLAPDLAVIAPAPPKDAGGCSTNTVVDKTKLQASAARVCTPSSCATTTCSPPIGRRLCGIATGDVACPAPFTEKHLIGASTALVCSPCGSCAIATTNCAGTLSLFGDSMCNNMQLLGAFATDAGCQSTNYNFASVMSYKWASFGTSSCAIDASTPATAPLSGEQTVCCRPGL